MFRNFIVLLLLTATLAVGATAIVGSAQARTAACQAEVDC
jgi:hypothetical protein